MKLNFLILAAISNGIINYAQAETSQTILPETINNWTVRKDRLNKIHASLFTAKVNISALDRDIKELIHNYKKHLRKFETEKEQGKVNNSLVKDIELLLAKLETGQEIQIKDQMHAKDCYELLSAIESLFEKLENPQEERFDSLALPQQSSGIVKPYKKLKGEKLPCHVISAKKKKKHYENEEIPAVSLAQVKMSTHLSKALEEENHKP